MSHTQPHKYPFKGWGYKFFTFLQLPIFLEWGLRRIEITERFPLTIPLSKTRFWFEIYGFLKFSGCHWPMAIPFTMWHHFYCVIRHGTIVTYSVTSSWKRGCMEYDRKAFVNTESLDLRWFLCRFTNFLKDLKSQSLWWSSIHH